MKQTNKSGQPTPNSVHSFLDFQAFPQRSIDMEWSENSIAGLNSQVFVVVVVPYWATTTPPSSIVRISNTHGVLLCAHVNEPHSHVTSAGINYAECSRTDRHDPNWISPQQQTSELRNIRFKSSTLVGKGYTIHSWVPGYTGSIPNWVKSCCLFVYWRLIQ